MKDISEDILSSFIFWYGQNINNGFEDRLEPSDSVVCYSIDKVKVGDKESLKRNYKKWSELKEGDCIYSPLIVWTVNKIQETSTSLLVHFNYDGGTKFGCTLNIPLEEAKTTSRYHFQCNPIFTSFYEYRDYQVRNFLFDFQRIEEQLTKICNLELDVLEKEKEANMQKEQEKKAFIKKMSREHTENVILYILSKYPNKTSVLIPLLNTIWLCDKISLQRNGRQITMCEEDKCCSYIKTDNGPQNKFTNEFLTDNTKFNLDQYDMVHALKDYDEDNLTNEEKEIIDEVIRFTEPMTSKELHSMAVFSPENQGYNISANKPIYLVEMLKSYKTQFSGDLMVISDKQKDNMLVKATDNIVL